MALIPTAPVRGQAQLWTDHELVIALDESLLLEEAIARLDRSPQAIAAKRATAAQPRPQ